MEVGSATEGFGYDVGGVEADGELMAEAADVSGGEEWRARRNVGDSTEIEVALAVLGRVFEFLDGACGSADGAPADAVVSCDDDAAANVFGVGENIGEKIGLRFGVIGVKHGGADSGREFFLFGEGVEILKKSDGLLRREALRVFGEGLCGDTDGLNFVAAGFEDGFGAVEHL